MTPSSRTSIALSLIVALTIPFGVSAKVGLQPGFEPAHMAAPEPEPEPSLSPEELERLQQKQAKWDQYRGRTQGFWADMMNSRSTRNSFREQHQNRRQKRVERRQQCRVDIRKANRDALLRETLRCFRATLSQELEILRKERQYVETMIGVSFEFRGGADFHIGNLMAAITTIVQGIDSGAYTNKESLSEAKQGLGVYRDQKRLAMTRLRVDRSITWLSHLIVRLLDIENRTSPPEEVQAKIDEAVDCFEAQEEVLHTLLPMENNDALIADFRQVQSDVKFCIETARVAHRLNTELTQTDE